MNRIELHERLKQIEDIVFSKKDKDNIEMIFLNADNESDKFSEDCKPNYETFIERCSI